MQEVLNTLERHTVCTGTQCFESEEDAFGITTTPNGTPSNSTNFFMFMMCAPPLPPPPRPSDLTMRREVLQSSASHTQSPRRRSLPKAPGERTPYCYGAPQPHQHPTALSLRARQSLP